MTRHITRRETIVREREADGTLAVTKVPTADNLADMFTKALARDPFMKLRKLVMNILTCAGSRHRYLERVVLQPPRELEAVRGC